MMTISRAVYILLDILSWIIVIKSILTWFPDRGGRLYDTLSTITEPLEAPVRNVVQRYNTGVVDFTPMITLIIIMVLRNILLRAMYI